MAPKTRAKSRAKSAKAGAKDPNPKQPKLSNNTREDEGHCGASKRSEDTESAFQDTTVPAANVPAAPLDSIDPVDPQESPAVPSPAVPQACYERRRRNGQPTEDELEVANFLLTEDLRDRWVAGLAAVTMVQMKNDPNYSPPVQK